MCLDLPARVPLDLLDSRRQPLVVDLGHATAHLAHDVVVVMTGFARDVRVLAAGQVDALQQIELGQQVERAKDGGTTDARSADTSILDEVRGSEVAFARGNKVRHSTARLGQSVPGRVKCFHEGL